MPNKQKNRNTGRKHTVIRDDLQITGPGVYLFTPFNNIDQYRRTLIKVGESSKLETRADQYSTYFPGGVFMLGFLTNIKGKRPVRGKPEQSPKAVREEIEQFILDYVSTHDNGKRVYSTDRVRKQDGNLEGQTEWMFSRVENAHAGMQEASQIYRADLHLYYLQGINEEGKYEDVLKTRKKKLFKGEIII